ncbi:MAG: hypothetical protein MMC33_002748 [Icmadophila ericetorum]|nr:hypothetical protein [Icmadophila ericetorum]
MDEADKALFIYLYSNHDSSHASIRLLMEEYFPDKAQKNPGFDTETFTKFEKELQQPRPYEKLFMQPLIYNAPKMPTQFPQDLKRYHDSMTTALNSVIADQLWRLTQENYNTKYTDYTREGLGNVIDWIRPYTRYRTSLWWTIEQKEKVIDLFLAQTDRKRKYSSDTDIAEQRLFPTSRCPRRLLVIASSVLSWKSQMCSIPRGWALLSR